MPLSRFLTAFFGPSASDLFLRIDKSGTMSVMQILIGNSLIRYEVTGREPADGNPAIVFLHGWGRTHEDFSNLSGRLAGALPNISLFAIDLPGFGGSVPALPAGRRQAGLPGTAGTRGFSLDDYARVLREFLDKLGIARATLVGHSFGGRIAVKFAAVHPERVEKLVLVSAAGVPARSLRSALLSLGRGVFRTVFFAVRDFRFTLRLKNLLGVFFGSDDYRATGGMLRETFKNVVGEDLRPVAERIVAPTLLMWGRNDEITPLGNGEVYRGCIKNSRLTVIEGGHFAFFEKPEESSRALLEFLKE